MKIEEVRIGQEVSSTVAFVDVPRGTRGVIVEDYGSGFMVAWDLPDRPYPHWKSPEEVGAMMALEKHCPLRDGFDKELELGCLVVAPAEGAICPTPAPS